ncbi:hypothetical protein BDA99DRAFT_512651, partial [Phascolomyces articulosus]
MKLLAYGAVMKNNDERLSSYGIRDGSKVILMAAPANKVYISEEGKKNFVYGKRRWKWRRDTSIFL